MLSHPIQVVTVVVAGLQSFAPASSPERDRVKPIEFPFDLVESRVDELILAPDLELIDTFESEGPVSIESVPLPGGELVALDLRSLDVHARFAGVTIDGIPAQHRLRDSRISLWKGTVRGDPRSEAYLALSISGCRGWIRRGEDLFHLLTEPSVDGDWSNCTTRLVTDSFVSATAGNPTFICGTIDSPSVDGRTRSSAPNGPQSLLECTIAVEGDFQLFQRFNDVNAELSYVVALLGAVSARYEEQIQVVLTYPYLNLWTTPNDRWQAQDSAPWDPDVRCSALVDEPQPELERTLNEFRRAWDQDDIPTGANLGHLLSGACLGGGMAYMGSLCNLFTRFAVSGQIDGEAGFPVEQGPLTWDFVVVAHEIGHNFGARHTHELCPPLDRCAPDKDFGDCQSERSCIENGTLMSYCHSCTGGMSNITTYFHSAQLPAMRSAAEDACLRPYAPPSSTYVDCSWQGDESGTSREPFNSVAEGILNVAIGRRLVLKSTTCSAAPLTIHKAMTLDSVAGQSVID